MTVGGNINLSCCLSARTSFAAFEKSTTALGTVEPIPTLAFVDALISLLSK